MKATSTKAVRVAMLALLALAVRPTEAVTLEELRARPKLTPQRFARFFADFKYQRHDQVQPPEVFLATQAGDCDDYAILAANILREKGYTTRLVSVRMPSDVHVVCYVAETRSYLDYNNRAYLVRTVSSDGSLHDIAAKVAKSFETTWVSACEFTYAEGPRRLVSVATRRTAATETAQLGQMLLP